MGRIFAIKKYAIHDGPNIRTTVFLKGCPLSCLWCHNPEGMNTDIALLTTGDKCIGCNTCIDACVNQSLSRDNNSITLDDSRCSLCLNCLEACPACVYESTGWEASVEEVVGEVKKDIPFYDQSGGGVTFSGGEPLLQHEFLLELLRKCGNLGIHRVVDTSGYAATPTMLGIARETDMFLIDLKHMDNARHRHFIGVDNELILHNISTLADQGEEIYLRIPLIEGFNCDEDNIAECGRFIAALPGVNDVDLLPYHAIAAAKYKKLGLPNPGDQFASVPEEKITRYTEILNQYGLHVQVGG